MLIWGFVLGPIGALLSVPLTMTVKVILERNDDLRWVAMLMGTGSEISATINLRSNTVPAMPPVGEPPAAPPKVAPDH
jgi:hypothetical protein